MPKELVVHLAFYLSHKKNNELLIRNILWQVIDASKQQSSGGRSLLLSTILEASLRTLYEIPFIPGRLSRDDPFKPKVILEKFQSQYLSGIYDEEWKKIVPKILGAYKRLRHRYAHPDWISSEGGMLSDEKLSQSINDTIFLSHFYGYMILALSGLNDVRPVFPKPFAEWGPIMTMTRK